MIKRGFLLLGLALGGCTAAQCDPSRADFFTGVGCAAGPGYADRRTALQNTLAGEQYQAYAARQEAVEQHRRAAQYEATAAALQQQLVQIRRDQAALRQRLAAAARRRGAGDTRVRQASAQLDQLERRTQTQQTSASPDAGQVRELQQQVQQLVTAASQL
jgi:chromosome segregation ATPase